MSYATIAQLRAYLEQTKISVDKDAVLQDVLDRANAIITDYLGFSFGEWPSEDPFALDDWPTGESAAVTDEDVLCRYGGYWLTIPAHMGGSVSAVTSLSSRGASSETETTESDWLEESDGRLYRYSGWSPGWYRVTATWGYGPAPASVIEVELEVATNIWKSKDAGSFGNSLGVEGGGAVTVNRAMEWRQRNILDGVRTTYLGVVIA